MKKSLIILSILLTFGCTTPKTPAQSVYLAESDYAVALRAELAYSALPRCTTPATQPICSTASIIKTLQKSDDVAYSAIKAAETAVRTPGFSTSTVTTIVASATALTQAFISITQSLGVK